MAARAAAFSLRGERNGRVVTIYWRSGRFTGDSETVEWLVYLARTLDSIPQQTLTGVTSTHNHLSNPYIARMLAEQIFAKRPIFIGYLPPLDADLPKGAVM